MLVAWVVFPALLVAVSAGCGLAVVRASGQALPRPLVLPVGLAATVVVASATTALEAAAVLATPLVLLLALAGFALAGDRRAWVPEPWAAGAALGVFSVFAAPVVLSGSATFTGYIQLDDIATWLALTDQVMERGRALADLPPSSFEATVSSYLPGGYPVGGFLALGLGHKLTLGHDIAWLFAPTMALSAGMLALSLTAVVAPLLARPWARALVAFLAAQSALLFAYAEWGAIKEVTAALLVALVAALAPTLGGPLGGRALARGVLPLAVAIGALIATLSVGGGVWIVPVVVVALVAARARPHALRISVPALTATVALLTIPSLALANRFIAPQLQEGSVLSAGTELGNLRAPLSFAHVLGIWPAGDFRTTPAHVGLTAVVLLLLVVAAGIGLVLAIQRRAGALAGYLIGGLAACLGLISRGSPWVDAKAMATAAPIVLTAGLAALGWVAIERSERALRATALGLLGLIGAGVLWSNVLGYANAYVAPRQQLAELAAAGKRLAGRGPTLMTEYEPYGARHFLRRAEGEGASELRRRVIPLRDGSQLPKSAAADITAFDPTALREYRSLVLRTSPLASRPPSQYRRIARGESYDVWQRQANAPAAPVGDLPLGGDTQPGADAPCEQVRALAERAGPTGRLIAVERAAPTVVALGVAQRSGAFQPGADPRLIVPLDDGHLTTQVSVATGGRYAVWVGGSTRGATSVRVDGRETGTVQGRLNNQGAMMRFGSIRLEPGAHRVELDYDDDGLGPGQKGQKSLGLPLGPLVLAPPERELTPFTVPALEAETLCNRRLDWIEAYAG